MKRAEAELANSASALTRLCDIDDIDEDEPFRAEVEGVGYAVFKVGDLVFVTADLCTMDRDACRKATSKASR